MPISAGGTDGIEYTERLDRMGNARWKRALNAQAPYRWNMRRLHLGETLDVGCGLGRNLQHLEGHGVGVDTNPTSVEVCRSKGLEAFTVEDFLASELAAPGRFDSLLIAHVLEHLTAEEGVELVGAYVPFVHDGGQVVIITPQERGFASDPTHVRFVDFEDAEALAQALDLDVYLQFSFPFPRGTGRLFTYNEFVTVAHKPG
jgi:2-polyprenyl-3-methyl-5-hydroxy-6-metoxy-1,4-benzoquinol methylase